MSHKKNSLLVLSILILGFLFPIINLNQLLTPLGKVDIGDPYVNAQSAIFQEPPNHTEWTINSGVDPAFSSDDKQGMVYVDSNLNAYICGVKDRNFSINKYDEYGNIIWEFEANYSKSDFGSYPNQATSIIVGNSSDVYVTGYKYGDGFQDNTIITVKINEVGNEIWNKTWNASNSVGYFGKSIKIDSNNQTLYVVGHSNLNGVNDGGSIINYDSDGNQIKNHTILSYGYDDLEIDNQGYLYVLANWNDGASDDSYVEKFDANFNQVWRSSIYEDTEFYSINLDSEGSLIITGKYQDNGHVWKFFNNGTLDWDFQSDFLDRIWDSYVDEENNIITVSEDQKIRKWNGSSGGILWQKQLSIGGLKSISPGYRFFMVFADNGWVTKQSNDFYEGFLSDPSWGTESGEPQYSISGGQLIYNFTDEDVNLTSNSYDIKINKSHNYYLEIKHKNNNSNQTYLVLLNGTNATLAQFNLLGNNYISPQNYLVERFSIPNDISMIVDRFSFMGAATVNGSIIIDYIKIIDYDASTLIEFTPLNTTVLYNESITLLNISTRNNIFDIGNQSIIYSIGGDEWKVKNLMSMESFEDIPLGTFFGNDNWTNNMYGGASSNFEINSGKHGRRRILILDDRGEEYLHSDYQSGQNLVEGMLNFWVATSNTSLSNNFILLEDSTIIQEFSINGNKFRYNNGTNWNNITDAIPDTWYNIQINVNMTSDTYDFFINDNLFLSEEPFSSSGSVINKLSFRTVDGIEQLGFEYYVDDIRFNTTNDLVSNNYTVNSSEFSYQDENISYIISVEDSNYGVSYLCQVGLTHNLSLAQSNSFILNIIDVYNDTKIEPSNFPLSPTLYSKPKTFNFTSNITELINASALNISSVRFKISNETWDNGGYQIPSNTSIQQGAHFNYTIQDLSLSNYTLSWIGYDMSNNFFNHTEFYIVSEMVISKNQTHSLVFVNYDTTNSTTQMNVSYPNTIHFNSSAFGIDMDGILVDTNVYQMNFTVNSTYDLAEGFYPVNVSSPTSWGLEYIEVKKRAVSFIPDYSLTKINGTTKNFTINGTLLDSTVNKQCSDALVNMSYLAVVLGDITTAQGEFTFEAIYKPWLGEPDFFFFLNESSKFYYNETHYFPSTNKAILSISQIDQTPLNIHIGDDVNASYEIHNSSIPAYKFYNGSFDISIESPNYQFIYNGKLLPGQSNSILSLDENGLLKVSLTNVDSGNYIIHVVTDTTFDYESNGFYFIINVLPPNKTGIVVNKTSQSPSLPDGNTNDLVNINLHVFNASNPSISIPNERMNVEIFRNGSLLQTLSSVYTDANGEYSAIFNLQGNGNYNLRVTTFSTVYFYASITNISINIKEKSNLISSFNYTPTSLLPGQQVNGVFEIYEDHVNENANWTELKLLSNSTDNSHSPRSTLDVNSNFHVVWYEDAGSFNDILYRKWNVNTKAWSDIQNISTESTAHSYFPDIDSDSKGNLHVVWCDLTDYLGSGSDFDILYKVFNVSSQSWEAAEVVSQNLDEPSLYPKIIIDDNDNTHIAWVDANFTTKNDVFYRFKNASTSTWSNVEFVSTEDFSNFSQDVEIRVDGNGNVHAVWNCYEIAPAHLGIHYKMRNITTEMWENFNDLSYNNSVLNGGWIGWVNYPTLDIDSNNDIHFIFTGSTLNTSQNEIIYRVFNQTTGQFTDCQILTGGNLGTGRNDMVIDDFNNIHVIWDDETNYYGNGFDKDVFYMIFNSTTRTWNPNLTLVSLNSSENSQNCRLEVDANNDIYIIWEDTTAFTFLGDDTDADICFRSTNWDTIFDEYRINNLELQLTLIDPNNQTVQTSTQTTNHLGASYSFYPTMNGTYILNVQSNQSYNYSSINVNYSIIVDPLPINTTAYGETLLSIGITEWTPTNIPDITITIKANASTTLNVSLLDYFINQSLNLTDFAPIFINQFLNIQIGNESALEWIYIQISYENIDLPGFNLTYQKLRLVHYNTTIGMWELLSTWTIDAANDYLTGNCTHLSHFALLGIEENSSTSSGGGDKEGSGDPVVDYNETVNIAIDIPPINLAPITLDIPFELTDSNGVSLLPSQVNITATLNGQNVNVVYDPATGQYKLQIVNFFFLSGQLIINVEYDGEINTLSQSVFEISGLIPWLIIGAISAIGVITLVRSVRRTSTENDKRIVLKLRKKFGQMGTEDYKNDKEVMKEFLNKKKESVKKISDYMKKQELVLLEQELENMIEYCTLHEDSKGYLTAEQYLQHVRTQVAFNKSRSEKKGKIVFLGDGQSGKTAARLRYIHMDKNLSHDEIAEKAVQITRTNRPIPSEIQKGEIFLTVMDTGGQDTYLQQLKSYSEMFWGDVRLIVWFIDSQKPERLEKSYKEFLEFKRDKFPEDVKILIALSKYDEFDNQGKEHKVSKISSNDIQNFKVPTEDVIPISIYRFDSLDILFKKIYYKFNEKFKQYPVEKVSLIMFTGLGPIEIDHPTEIKSEDVPNNVWIQHPTDKLFSEILKSEVNMNGKRYVLLSMKVADHLEGQGTPGRRFDRDHESICLHQVCVYVLFGPKKYDDFVKQHDAEAEAKSDLSSELEMIGRQALSIIESEEEKEFIVKDESLQKIREYIEREGHRLIHGEKHLLGKKLTKEEKKVLKKGKDTELEGLKKKAKEKEAEGNNTMAIQCYKDVLRLAEDKGIKLSDAKKIQKKIEKLEKEIEEKVEFGFNFQGISI